VHVLQVPPQPSLVPQTPEAQLGVQQLWLWHTWPLVQVLQVPPQPLLTPQVPGVQLGVQQSFPPDPLSTQLSPAAQPPVHKPPQPSLSPQTLPEQFGVQQALW
jgi:hypothetical protein